MNFKVLLESELDHPVIIIPWTSHEDDVYGHSDGFIKWCGDNRILMGNYGDRYSEEPAYIRRILESYGFEVTEMRFNGNVDSHCYNFNWVLKTDDIPVWGGWISSVFSKLRKEF